MYRNHRFARRSFVFLSLMALIVLALAGVTGTSAAPSAQPAREKFKSAVDEGVNTSAARHWTAAELRAARPLAVRARRSANAAIEPAPGPDGPAGSVAGILPTQQAPDGGPSLQSSEVPSYSTYPYSTVGKVFFNQGGGSYVCSASIVKPTVIWTAGHCVHAGNGWSGGWSTNVVFVPQYRDGSAPLGQCSVTNLVTTSDWYYYGNPNGLDHDYAVGRLACNVSGTTGTLGFSYNQSYSQTYTAVGYPAGSPFTGGRMIACGAGFQRYGFGSPTTFSIVCDMTGGSSGGPYIINSGSINGNVSYGDSNYPGELFSPYFNSDAKALYDYLT